MNARLVSVIGALAVVATQSACQAPKARRSLIGDAVLPPTSAIGFRHSALTTGDGPNGEHILFVNFEGATIAPPSGSGWGGDDPVNNKSFIADQSTKYPAFDAAKYASDYTRQQAMDKIIAEVAGYYEPFNVLITTTRPSSGDYTMMMVGGYNSMFSSSSGGGTVGIAPMDCGNQMGGNIGFAFAKSLEPQSNWETTDFALSSIATTVAHEAGHSFGLEHTLDETDIMYPSVSETVVGFGGVEQLADGNSDCDGKSTQNTSQRLLDNLGTKAGGSTGGTSGGSTSGGTSGSTVSSPKLSWLQPIEGSTVGGNFEIAVHAEVTGSTIAKVQILQGTSVVFEKTTPPYRWPVSLESGGSAQLKATATAADGGKTSITVNFDVDTTLPDVTDEICLADVDCFAGDTCQSGLCKKKPTSTTGGGGTTGGGTTGGGSTTGGSSTGGGSSGTTDPSVGDMGDKCSQNAADNKLCAEGLTCANVNNALLCTAACDPNDASTCTNGTVCTEFGSGDEILFYCAPKKKGTTGGGGSGGCSTHGAPDASLMTLLLIGGAALVARRRRLA